MGPVSAQLDIDVARERAFDFIADLGNRSSFTDHFLSEFRLLGIESAVEGAGARFRCFAPPRAQWMDSAIHALEPPRRISERGHGGRSNRTAWATEWELLDGPGGLTSVRVVQWSEPAKAIDRAIEIAGAASLWLQRDWRTALRRLRDLLESGEPEPASRPAGGNRVATGVP